MTKLYLAGPDVFHPDARDLGLAKKQLCARYGLDAVFPLDVAAPTEGHTLRAQGLAIAAKDLQLVSGCTAALVNLTPYLGPAMDTGSAVELGYMVGRGGAVWGYTNAAMAFEARATDAIPPDWTAEAFGLTDNLMVEGAIEESGGQVFRPDRDLAFDDLSVFERCVAAFAAQARTG